VFRTQLIAPFVRFGRWVMLTGILGLIGTTVLQLAVSRQLGAGALGLYFLASKVALLPLGAANAVVGSVAFPLFADLRDDATRTAAAFRTLLTGQMILLLPVYCILIVLAPALETALGPRWIGTAPVMQILGTGAAAALFGETLGPLFMGKGQSARTFALEVVQTGLLLAVLWPLIRALGVSGAATAWLVGTVAALLVGFVWIRRMLPGERVAEWSALLATAAAALAGAAVASLAAAALPSLPGLVVGAASGLVVATTLLIVLDRLLGLELSRLARVMGGSMGSSEERQSAGAVQATEDDVARRSVKG
jgi:O-antigen/teichoic acid export membrane protein